MPTLSKKSLSMFLRIGCERQFILSLYRSKHERLNAGMPLVDPNRAGLGLVGKAGYTYQAEKVRELAETFGELSVRADLKGPDKQPAAIDLLTALETLQSYQFLVEASYDANTLHFRQALGIVDMCDHEGRPVEISKAQPDILQTLPPLKDLPTSTNDAIRDPARLGVEPDGTLTLLSSNDDRLRLRIIDVKLASEPGAHYFAEVVYYSMTLAAWLQEHKLNTRFVVIAAPAVWPGNYDTSSLSHQLADWRRKSYFPSPLDLAQALEADLELGDIEVFAPRLRALISHQLPELLQKPWKELNWHVDFRCKGCELLGSPKPNYTIDQQEVQSINPPDLSQSDDLCWPTAERVGHLSRVVGLTRGATAQLRSHSVSDVLHLAQESTSSAIFDQHQGLRSKRNAFPHRAQALLSSASSLIPDSGGDALMPRWPDLHVHVFIDYDLGTAITAAIGVRAFWVEPLPFDSPHKASRMRMNWPQKGAPDVFLVDDHNGLARERQEFLRFLNHLHDIFAEVIQHDETDYGANRRGNSNSRERRSTYQIYLWDESQRKHLVRLMGRYLTDVLADKNLRDLAWLFPPPELLQKAEEATRRTPFTIVSEVINNTLAVPVAHHYRLIDIARLFAGPLLHNKPQLNSNGKPFDPYFMWDLYQEPMSDLTPAERIHEWWEHAKNWQEVFDRIRQTSQTKVRALGDIVECLEKTIGAKLSRQAAPSLDAPPKSISRLAPQSRLIYEFLRLNVALEGLDIDHTRAMPPYERAARSKSARLERRLTELERKATLQSFKEGTGETILDQAGLYFYKLKSDSYELNARPGDFNFALSPESQFGFLDQNAAGLLKGIYPDGTIEQAYMNQSVAEAGLTSVTVESIDRVNGIIVLRPSANAESAIFALEDSGKCDFSKNVVLDPIHQDFLTKKVALTLQGIGNPSVAVNMPEALKALATPPTKSHSAKDSEAAQLLWNATSVYSQPVQRDIIALRAKFESQCHVRLDDSQWCAWTEAMTRRLSLIWGPPGTGKSHTLRSIVIGALLDAMVKKRPIRLLVTANTYTAIDNVLLAIGKELGNGELGSPVAIYRIQSRWHRNEPNFEIRNPNITRIVLNNSHPDDVTKGLIAELNMPSTLSVVGCAPQQLHNLALAGMKYNKRTPEDTLKAWFDLIILDEASQMDVATSTLVFSKLAPEGILVLAGDDLQLPPIHQADPPDGLENEVGSIYNYFRHRHKIGISALNVNYRSNATIVELTRWAGYSDKLKSESPNLALRFCEALPKIQPKGWPSTLYWTPEWSRLLDPAQAISCFVYDDNLSGQVNEFEAAAVGSLAWLTRQLMCAQLDNEKVAEGSNVVPSLKPYLPDAFWRYGLGVVTPHRAQMAKVVQHLHAIFPPEEIQGIRSAVDTVERFQGQQRDMIIGSFGVGDPDVIASEDEFLYDLRRFNVLISRARAKLILFVTHSLLDHLSNDKDVLVESRLLKLTVDSYCRVRIPMTLGYVQNGIEKTLSGWMHTPLS